jgi:hypothetical protein
LNPKNNNEEVLSPIFHPSLQTPETVLVLVFERVEHVSNACERGNRAERFFVFGFQAQIKRKLL